MAALEFDAGVDSSVSGETENWGAPKVIRWSEATAPSSGYGVNWATVDQRLRDLKEFLLNAPQKMDPQRLKFLNEVYEEYANEEPVYIRAKLLERVLTQKDIFWDGNLLVGTLTGIRAGVYAYPEWNISWIKDEMDQAKMSSLGELQIPEETMNELKKVYKKWKGKTVNDRAHALYKELYNKNPMPYFKSGMLYEDTSITTGTGVADYPRILNEGISGILKEVDERMAALPKKVGNKQKLAFYRASKIALNAVIAYAHRYADMCEKLAEKESDPAQKREFLEIAEICRRVPEFPARNFREAIQSFWFTHVCIEIEQMGCACSPGRYGQYMYPFFKKDIEEGKLTRDQVLRLLKFQWIRHLEMAAYQGHAYALALSGHTGQTITIGGLTADGEDASNELEMLLLECQLQMRNIQPTISLFYTPKMKDEYLQKAIEVIRDGSGQPQFMNNAVVVERHLNRFGECGITIEDARNCANYGCVGTGVCGKGSFVTFDPFPNLVKPVELALNNGLDPVTRKQVGPETGNPEDFATYEEFHAAFMAQMDAMMEIMRRHGDVGNTAKEWTVPSVFRSCLLDGCLESGLYEEAGGPRYSQTLCITTGGIDTANSLLAIKHLVYDTKQVSMAKLREALAANFKGYEDIQKLCYEAPKHGNDNPEVDAFVRQLYRDIKKIYRSKGKDYLNHTPFMDAYSLSFHNYFGALMGALPTGRNAGIALTDGSVSAMPGTDVEGSTALIKSAAQAIDTVDYASNHFNFKFLPQALEGPQGARTLLSLVKTYFDLGGCHIQFNCVSSDTLKNAQVTPQDYKDLVVRVAGFSAYFTRLDKGVQNEIIKRTEYTS